MENKKGVELALNTLIIIAILLLVAVVIISFFLGSTSKVLGPIADLLGKGAEDIKKQSPFPDSDEKGNGEEQAAQEASTSMGGRSFGLGHSSFILT